ncbi:MFS transporter [Alkalimonas collagenimarina]|uniref:MFS transporter n=1 Tax=Alkalimonas collagenimarina TaxID=400390 RepID=A0ABT9H1W8_9GAMM|nr:MFS transporter [Alkalimonas collagenimarina]MDP4537218.1 MFS transporter [Alkalimonas collagenimarina]
MSQSGSYKAFSSLYFSTFLMVLGAGLLTTYLGLLLSKESADPLWIGALMSAYYLGLVLGSKVGHRLIARVGHIRAFVASAGVVTASALCHGLVPDLTFWLLLRFLVGMGMMTQYMVLESWLNEQADNHQRGTVFAFYMIVSYFGLIAGQMVVSSFPDLGPEPLLLVAIGFALSIVPIGITRRIHPAPLHSAPLQIMTFWRRIPQSLSTITVAGIIVGAFYGMAPAFASQQGIPTEQIAIFMSITIIAGLLAQWPMGKLSDRIPRSRLLRTNSALLTIVVLCIALFPLSGMALMIATFCFGFLAFSLYPIAAALANQHAEQHERVSLSAVILLTFGIGACFGPILASALMQWVGNFMLYGFMAVCSFLLFLRLQRVNYSQKQAARIVASQQAEDYVIASSDVFSSPLRAALDPRVDEDMVQEHMLDDPEIAEDTNAHSTAGSSEDDPIVQKQHDDAEPPADASLSDAETTESHTDSVSATAEAKNEVGLEEQDEDDTIVSRLAKRQAKQNNPDK